jgi:hypothetical protein
LKSSCQPFTDVTEMEQPTERGHLDGAEWQDVCKQCNEISANSVELKYVCRYPVPIVQSGSTIVHGWV